MMTAAETPRLRLVGDLYSGAPSKTNSFLINTFGRFREVKHAGEVTRQVQYATGAGDNDYIHFLGIEVGRVEGIPEGLTAWDIDGDSWRILQSARGEDVVVWRETLRWKWLDQSVPGRLCGEFAAKCPAEWSDEAPVLREFRTVSNGYVGVPVDDDIQLVDYDPSWPQKYMEMQEWLKGLLGPEIALRIEHYGSTSIPGMPAKPVIDILVEVPSFEEARKRVIPVLNRPEVEYWCSDHMRFYIRDSVTGVRTCHLHMAPAGHTIWRGLVFRDYLRANPEDASRYVDLKRELAGRHREDRAAYTDAKEAFVLEITAKALRENHA